jgi:opacity protein-like surface antigen
MDNVSEDTTIAFRKGYVAGMYTTLVINRYFSYHGELLYSQKGSQFDSQSDHGGAIRIDYIEIPQILTFGQRSRLLYPYGYFGINPSFSIYGKEYAFYDMNYSFRQHIFKSDDNRFQFALLYGLGVDYEYINGLTFNADFRFVQGLSPVNNTLKQNPKDRNFYITVGVKLRIDHLRH